MLDYARPLLFAEEGATPGLKAFSSDKERRRSKKVSIKAGMGDGR